MFIKTTNRSIANVVLVANIFIWYFIAFQFIKGQSGNDILLIIGSNAVAIACSALIASITLKNLKNSNSFFNLWILAGVLISFLPLLFKNADIYSKLFIAIIFGVYFGFGMPKTLGHYAASIEPGKRGTISGITFLIIALLSAILGLFVFNVLLSCIMLASIRFIGLLSFRALDGKGELSQDDSMDRTFSYPLKKTFILYFVPWAVFCLVNYFTIPIITNTFEDYPKFLASVPIIENVVIAMSAVVSGILADRLGRKRLIMVGFVMLGIGFASLGLFVGDSPVGIFPQIVGYVYTVSDGVAWGIFYVMFLLTLWGDIAKSGKVEILYVLGALPFIFADTLQYSFQIAIPILSEIGSTQIFSFASVFLFLAVIPLLYAPETLSEKIIANQELSNYVDKALEKVKKENLKKPKSPQLMSKVNLENTRVREQGTTGASKEYEEACKMAEKYY